MRRVIGIAAGCALIGVLGTPQPTHGHERLIVLADDTSLRLFDSTIRAARHERVEMGGCFRYFPIATTRIIAYEARVHDMRRKFLEVTVDCPVDQGVWHTHWITPDDTAWNPRDLRCAPSERDRQLNAHLFGIVVCGIGRDSLVGFTGDTT